VDRSVSPNEQDVDLVLSFLAYPWATIFSWGGFVFGLLVNLGIIISSLPFYFDYSGRGAGMLSWYLIAGRWALFAFLVGVPCGITAMMKGRRRLGRYGIVLGLTPAPLAYILLSIATRLFNAHFR
jgi:hypothetical protein